MNNDVEYKGWTWNQNKVSFILTLRPIQVLNIQYFDKLLKVEAN